MEDQVEDFIDEKKKKKAIPRRPSKHPQLKILCRSLYDIQQVRIQVGARLYEDPEEEQDFLDDDTRTKFEEHHKELINVENSYEKTLVKLLKNVAIYSRYLTNIRGCGTLMSAILVSEIDDISKFATISKLWAYSGYGLYDGEIQKRKAGVKSNWNTILKSKLYVLGGCLLKAKNEEYSKLYNDYKHRILQRTSCHLDAKRHGSNVEANGCTKGHRHAMAMRYMLKIFLQNLYLEWYRLEGLTPRPPYAEEYLNHKHETGKAVESR